MILYSFEVFATEPNFIIWDMASKINTFIVSLFLKLLGIVKILLANSHLFLKLGG